MHTRSGATPARVRRRAAAAATAVLTAVPPTAAGAAPPQPVLAPDALTRVSAPVKLPRYQAYRAVRAAGIRVWSTGGCMRRNHPLCTSFDNINKATVLGAVTLARASRCLLTVTGGTETGHELPTPSRYTHWNGYKLDLRLTPCLNRYVTTRFRHVGGALWRAESGNLYLRERDHWDVTFFTCGC